MRASKNLAQYRQALQEAVGALGRDDIGVGEVRLIRDGVLAVTFQRGTHQDVREIPVDTLQRRDTAHQAVTEAIRPLSKEVEREVMERA